MAWFVFIIVLWTLAPRGTPQDVFTTFQTQGWSSVGFACLIGLNGPVAYLTGADASVHLSEELKDAAYVLPRSMVATGISNYLTSFLMIGEELVEYDAVL